MFRRTRCNLPYRRRVAAYPTGCLVVSLLLITWGCDGQWQLGGLAKPAPATAPAASPGWPGSASDEGGDRPTDTGPRRPTLVARIDFDVLRARVPRGFFSQSEKVWNHLNEAAIPRENGVLLQRNGLRAAIGDANSWPPLRALLEQEGTVESSHDHIVLGNGLPLVIEPDQRPRDQTVFVFRPEGSLSGASFPQSVNGLLMEYALAGAGADRLRISVMPQIRLPKQPPRLSADAPGFVSQPLLPPTRILRELAFMVEVGPEQFIAIGPSRPIENVHLMGSLLLCEEKDGRRWESMYFITPKVLNTGQRTGF